MTRDMTYIANASGRPLRVYYSMDRMTLDEIEIVFGIKARGSKSEGVSESVSAETKMAVKRYTHVRYLRIPQEDYSKILGEGDIYVTVFVEKDAESDDYLNISHNFYVPSNRSFIVTANYSIKFQNYGASIWEDEQGINHRE